MVDVVEGLRYERRDHVAYITLDRPDRGNSLSPPMHGGLREIWEEVRDDSEIRATIITGTGERHFCTGGDMGAVAGRGGVAVGAGPLTDEAFWSPRQNRVWKPTICAVNGMVAGSGLQFVVDADIVVSVESAVFLDNHVNVGMVGSFENVGLARRLPLGSALRMTVCGRDYRMPAKRAYDLGIVDELVEPAQLMDTAEEIAGQICRNSPTAVSLSMQAVWASQEMGYTQANEYAWALARLHWRHPDYVEGPRALMEKREPNWTVDD